MVRKHEEDRWGGGEKGKKTKKRGTPHKKAIGYLVKEERKLNSKNDNDRTRSEKIST